MGNLFNRDSSEAPGRPSVTIEEGMVVKSARELDVMRRAGRVVAKTLALLQESIKAGMTTADLDTIAEDSIRGQGAIPSFIGYRGFPASVCVSINEEIVHGIPGSRVIKNGDVVGMDVGAIVDGYHGDAAVTVGVGDITPEARKLIDTTRDALNMGIEAAKVGARLGDVGAAVQQTAEAGDYSVVREYVGHGIGRRMHEEPGGAQLRQAGKRDTPATRNGPRHRADAEHRRVEDEAAGRRLDCRNRGRQPFRPLRAQHGSYRIGPGDTDPALTEVSSRAKAPKPNKGS